MKQNFNKSGKCSVLLTKADLKEIQSLLSADSKEYKIRIDCRIANLSLNAESFNEFIDNEGIPEQFDYLSISASLFSDNRESAPLFSDNREMEKWVNIESYTPNNLRFYLSGANEIWVSGLFNKLAETFGLLEQQRKNLSETTAPNSKGEHPSETTSLTSKREYQQNGNIQACILTRDDLIELVNILQSDASSAEDLSRLTIYSELPGIKIEANNIHQFLEQKNLPEKLSDLKVYVFGKDNAVASIYIETLISSVTVNGTNEIWVRGKYSQLMDFLKKRRLWYWFLQKPFAFIAMMLFIISLSAIPFSIIEKQVFGIFFSSISMIAWMLALIFHLNGKLLPTVYIDLRPKHLRFSKEDISLIVAILTFVLYLFELFVK